MDKKGWSSGWPFFMGGGFWHASTKWGLRTKDHAGRYRIAMTKTRRANPLFANEIVLEELKAEK